MSDQQNKISILIGMGFSKSLCELAVNKTAGKSLEYTIDWCVRNIENEEKQPSNPPPSSHSNRPHNSNSSPFVIPSNPHPPSNSHISQQYQSKPAQPAYSHHRDFVQPLNRRRRGNPMGNRPFLVNKQR